VVANTDELRIVGALHAGRRPIDQLPQNRLSRRLRIPPRWQKGKAGWRRIAGIQRAPGRELQDGNE